MKKKLAMIIMLLIAAWPLLGPGAAPAQEQTAYREAVAQADRQFQAGNFRNAVERYFFASQVAKERLEYARAYIGLAMSYMYLKDESSAQKYLKLSLEVAPRLLVAVPDYPISFVQLYDRVRNDFFKGMPLPAADEKLEKGGGEAAALKTQPEAATPPVKQPDSARSNPAASEEPAAKRATPPPTPPVAQTPGSPVLPSVFGPGGHVQVMFHASSWTIDPIINVVEGLVKDKVGDEILGLISSEVRTKYFTLIEAGSEQTLDFDSSGSNFGFEVRYFSRGWGGTFSLGLAFDRTSIRLALSGRVKQNFTNGTSAEAEANGAVTTDLSSTVLSFRWDISPASRLTPFVLFGLGIAPFQGRVSYEYAGTYDAIIFKDGISGGEEMTLEELAEEQDFTLIDVLVILQLGVGMDIEIFRGLTGVVEAGLWDGFYLRGGLGYRF